MQGKLGVPTWRIVPDTAVESQWRFASVDAVSRSPEPPRKTLDPPASHRLPSMSDLVAQASQKLSEGPQNGEARTGCGAPMFRTGSGKPVSVTQSSMKRARSVLEGGNGGSGGSDIAGAVTGSSMFRRGVGAPVNVTDSSLRKAASILGEEFMAGLAADEAGGGAPMFQTGSGKPVLVRKNSMQAASSLLGEAGVDVPMFRTGSGMSVDVKETSLQKAASILGDDFAAESSSDFRDAPLFKTGSGKPVRFSVKSIQAATSLLGEINTGGTETTLDKNATSSKAYNRLASFADKENSVCKEHDESFAFQSGAGRPVHVRKTSIQRASSLLEGTKTEPGSGGNIASINNQDREFRPYEHATEGENNRDVPIFQTGLGRSVTIRQSSIQKAAAILGEGLCLEGRQACSDPPMFETGKCATFQSTRIQKQASVGVDSGKNRSYPGASSLTKGLGPSITVRRSSIQRAVAMLGNGERMETTGVEASLDDYFDPTTLKTTFKEYSSKDPSSSSNTGSHSCIENNTGHQQHDDTSPAGFHRSDTALTLKKNNQGVEIVHGIINRGERSHFARSDLDGTSCRSLNASSGSGSVNQNLSICLGDRITMKNSSGENFQQMESRSSLSSIRFHTVNGQSLPVSKNPLQCVNDLLNESNVEVLQSKTNENILLQSRTYVECNEGNVSYRNSISNNSSIEPTGLVLLKNKSSIQEAAASQHIQLNAPAVDNSSHDTIFSPTKKIPFLFNSSSEDFHIPHVGLKESMGRESSRMVLADITNSMEPGSSQMNVVYGRKGLRKRNSISPFKKPRVSRFLTPFNKTNCFISPLGSTCSPSTRKEYMCKTNFSSYYPPKFKRKSLMEFFGRPYTHNTHLPHEIKSMTPEKAENFIFSNTPGPGGGVDAMRVMLLQLGASSSNLSTEWVTNHYKWIVWKLACLERCYPDKACGKYLTVSNVLDELKYRYEREVNCGHRSALKRILDGDASPAAPVVLCISSVCCSCSPNEGNREDIEATNVMTSDLAETNNATVELTDGWYSMNAVLDVALSKLFLSGKLFVGQKLRIWGAGMSGWAGPVSPFEALKSVSLVLHINGTYRTHWAHKLGFCKESSPPMSFSCIKSGGGIAPLTLVGLTRIYPVLYKERFDDGGSVVRSERMENKILQLYNQRRANIYEDIVSEQMFYYTDDGDCEGAKISRILLAAAEPEVLMSDMSAEQLSSFTAFQAKQEIARQSNLHKKIEKALEDAGLAKRDVTSFMRVRVVGLQSKGASRKGQLKEGLITIWNPTESQKSDLVEGQIYSVTGLCPLTVCANITYLKARGPSCVWRHNPLNENFEFFYSPRKSIIVSHLGEVPLTSEFDLAAVVIYVGEAFHSGWQRKQWLFAADGSVEDSQETEVSNISLLAIKFSAATVKDEPPTIVNQALSGSTVGFYNLVKRPRDRINQIWVADATENSAYSIYHCIPGKSHLKETAEKAHQWAKCSASVIESLEARISHILGGFER